MVYDCVHDKTTETLLKMTWLVVTTTTEQDVWDWKGNTEVGWVGGVPIIQPGPILGMS